MTVTLGTHVASVIPELAQFGGSNQPPDLGSDPACTPGGRIIIRPGTLAACGALSVAVLNGLPDTAVSMSTDITLAVDPHLTSLVQAPDFFDYPPLDVDLRLMQGVYVDLPTPIIVGGKPVVPAVVANSHFDATLIEGPNNIHAIPDPNPIWNPATEGWYNPPPPSGVGDARWVVDDLPDPAGFPNQFYWLGVPSSEDGTSGIASACRQWAPNGSTPSAPSWQSIYPYKPSVRQHVYYGSGGKIVTVTKGVRFNLQFIEHMWADFGATKNAPFTWVIVGIVMDFPGGGYAHTLLDVGRNPMDGGAPPRTENNLVPGRSLNESGLQGDARPCIQLTSTQQRMLGNPGGSPGITTPFDYATRPKMWFGVWDGDHSIGGSYSTAGKHFLTGKQPATSTRYAVIGREMNALDRNKASHLVLFELRWWQHALVEQSLDEQYGQLSSTWKFGSYT